MLARVADVYNIIEEIAPFSLAEPWDNVGLLCGEPGREVARALVALEATEGVVREAQARGAQLLVTHHPILFHARKNLREDESEGRLLCALVRANLSLIAAHTNYDAAAPGLNDALAVELGLGDVLIGEQGLRAGRIEAVTLAELAGGVEKRLGATVRRFGPAGERVSQIAVLGGAGGEYWPQARAMGAQVLITGEARHHDALEAAGAGFWLLEAGHAATERVMVKALGRDLQTRLIALQYKTVVLESDAPLFGQ